MRASFKGFAMASAVALATVLCIPAARATGCKPVYASGETQFSGVSFVGTALTNVGELNVEASILSDFKPTGKKMFVPTSHSFSGPVTFTTMDNASLTPVGWANGTPYLYLLNTQASIVEGGWGHLNIEGLVDFSTGIARWFAKGQICNR